MADSTSSIPPSNSSRALSTGSDTALSGKTISAPPASDNTHLPIERAPRQLTEGSNEPKTIEGKVIYSNPESEEMRIATEEGEIALKTKANLPHGTKVAVRVYRRNKQIFADIEVIEEAAVDDITEEFIPDQIEQKEVDTSTLPLIKEGQKIQASLIPSEKTQKIDELINILSKVNKTPIADMDLGITFTKVQEILYGKQPEEVLNSLNLNKINNITNVIKDSFGIKAETTDKSNIGNLVQKTYSKPSGPVYKESPFTHLGTDNSDDLINILGTEALTKDVKPNTAPTANTSTTELLQNLDNVEVLTHKSLSAKKYTIDILKITQGKLDRKEIREHLININEETGNFHTPEYKDLPIKVAQIESFTPKGQPIVTSTTYNVSNIYAPTETESFMLEKSLNITEDSVIFFKAVPIFDPNNAEQVNVRLHNLENIDINNFDPYSNKEWGALKKSIQTLVSNTGQTQSIHNINNIIPNPTNNFTTTALFFLAALRFGAVKGWLGENLKELDNDSLDSITKDFTRISTMSKDATQGQWRTISMPLYYDGNLEQIQIYLQNEGYNEGDGSDNEKSTRFIFNIDLSNMGRMQLDGTIYKENKNMNMIIRTMDKLDEGKRNQITEKYIAGLEQTGFTGDISFQAKSIIAIK